MKSNETTNRDSRYRTVLLTVQPSIDNENSKTI